MQPPPQMETRVLREAEVQGVLVQVCQGDITLEPTDTIVNAANEQLSHASGVAGAISKKAGPEFDFESR
jgi:O-acetyl-ADP-ribose deacetylase (regulator of RNase III)